MSGKESRRYLTRLISAKSPTSDFLSDYLPSLNPSLMAALKCVELERFRVKFYLLPI